MTSNQDTNIVIRLKNIIEELKKYSCKDKNKILGLSIQERLNKSLVEYYNELDQAFTSLSLYNDKHNLSMMKKLNKD